MKHVVVEVTRRSSAPVERVWDLVAHASTWPEWSSMKSASLDRQGAGEPDGLGAIRRFKTPIGTSVEEVVAFDAPTHFAYSMLSGLAPTGYRSDVTLRPAPDGGTEITWHSEFNASNGLKAAWWRLYVRRIIGTFSAKLAKGAAKTPSGEPQRRLSTS
jgi:hypothetical protein